MHTIHRWTNEALASLPDKNGIRQRGMDMTRLETFTDAAFAFAVTLLVISVDDVPGNPTGQGAGSRSTLTELQGRHHFSRGQGTVTPIRLESHVLALRPRLPMW